jgi:bisanhydrobacterioruberin hydratase
MQILFQRYRYSILASLLLITYGVGLFGILSPYQESFLNLTFFHLFFTFGLFLLSYYKLSFNTLKAMGFAFSIGIIAEWLGVHTNILFGNYSYGDNLGPKIWEVPVVIGINWALLSAISCEMSRILLKRRVLQIILSAILMVGIDFLIEPVAHIMDYWHWEGNVIPVFNFVCWFVIALGVNAFYFRFTENTPNYFSFGIFFALLVFFLTLNIAL